MKRKVLSLILVMSLICSIFTVEVFASENTSNVGDETIIRIDSMDGMLFRKGEIDHVAEAKFEAKMTDITITHAFGNIKLEGLLNYDGNTYDFRSEGTLYPVKGGGVYDDKLVLGEMSTSTGLDVIQFRVENESGTSALIPQNMNMKGSTVITIVVSNKSTGDIIYAQGLIEKQDFQKMLAGAKKQVKDQMQKNGDSEQDINKKVARLLNMRDKQADKKESQVSVEVNPSNISINGASVNRSEMARLFDDLKIYGTVKLANYNVPVSIFQGSGYDSYNQYYSPYFFYHKYSVSSPYYITTQITMCDVTADYYDINSTKENHRLQVYYTYGLVVEYDWELGNLKLVYNNFGLDLQNMQLSMNKLANQNVFISRSIYGLLQQSGSIAKGAIALVPIASTVLSVWDYIQPSETQALGSANKVIYDSTYSAQLTRWGDKVIRGVVGDFNGYTMSQEGHYTLVEGEVSTPTGSCTKEWGYRYTARTYL